MHRRKEEKQRRAEKRDRYQDSLAQIAAACTHVSFKDKAMCLSSASQYLLYHKQIDHPDHCSVAPWLHASKGDYRQPGCACCLQGKLKAG